VLVPQLGGRDHLLEVSAAPEAGTGLRGLRQGGQVPQAGHLHGYLQDHRGGVSTYNDYNLLRASKRNVPKNDISAI